MSYMTKEEKFCLNLNGYEQNVLKSWKELEYDKSFCDLTLACEGKQIETHRFVLSSSSGVFKSLFLQNTRQHPIIFLRGIKYKDLANILNFLYQGVINIPQKELKGFLAVAEDLNINGLSEDSQDEDQSVTSDTPIKKQKCDVSNKKGLLKKKSASKTLELKSEIISNDSTKEEKRWEVDLPDEQIEGDTKQEMEFETELPKELETELNEQRMLTETEVVMPTESDATLSIKNDDGAQIDGDPYICVTCHIRYPDSKTLRRHKKTEHCNSEYSCDKCEFKSVYRSSLKLHREAVHECIIYKCDQCTYSATTKGNLTAHVKGKHERCQIFTCNQCNFKSFYKGDLRKHEKTKKCIRKK